MIGPNPRDPVKGHRLATCCFRPLSHLSTTRAQKNHEGVTYQIAQPPFRSGDDCLLLIISRYCRLKDFSGGGDKPPYQCGGNELSQSGGGGIRTPDTIAGIMVFKTIPFNHSGTPPLCDSQHYFLGFSRTLLLLFIIVCGIPP